MSSSCDDAAEHGNLKSSLAECLFSSTYVLALLGTGLSAPSGIPTFRGPGSSIHDNAWYATTASFEQEPALVWQYYDDRQRMAQNALPNAAHYALAHLAQSKSHFLAITQNIDGEGQLAPQVISIARGRLIMSGLSRKAGHNPAQIVELHGSLFSTRCSNDLCSYTTTADPNQQLETRLCNRCTRRLRPGVIRFGERLPSGGLARIDHFFDSVPQVDLMLVVGTSARVFPAAKYVHRARDKGAFIAQFNLERDDDYMEPGDWYVPGDVSVSLPQLMEESCL